MALVLSHQVRVLTAHVVEHRLFWQFACGAVIGWGTAHWLSRVACFEELLALVANDRVDLPHAEGQGAFVGNGSLALQLLLGAEVLAPLKDLQGDVFGCG